MLLGLMRNQIVRICGFNKIGIMRQDRKYNQTLGFYAPNMFLLHVNTDKSIKNWKKWDDKTMCTFLHEYIHFLQDISTVSGLYNIYVFGERLSDMVNQIYHMTDKMVRVPINIVPGPNNVYNNIVLKNKLEGTICLPDGVDKDNLQVSGQATLVDTPLIMNGQHVNMHEVRVPYQRGGYFLLGHYHISESMAYLAENVVYGNMPNVIEASPNYPYDVVRQLACFYSPQLANNLPLLFALCDYSLTFSHSGYALVNVFNHYVAAGQPTDWKRFVLNEKANTRAGGLAGQTTYAEGLLEIKKMAIDSLDKRFNNETYNDIRQWYYNIIGRAIDMRLNYPLLWNDLLEGGELRSNPQFAKLLNGIGLPVMTNNKNKSFFITKVTGCPLKKRRAMYLIAAGSITSALGGGIFRCKLYDICKADCRLVNKKCEQAPWKKARKWFVCPYGHMWYGWGLKEKELVR